MAPFVAFALLTLIFWSLQRKWPAADNQRRTLRDTVTDFTYILFNTLVGRALTRVVIIVVAAALAALLLGVRDPDALLTAFSSRSPIGAQPAWLQILELFVLGDLLGYWIHRAFHSRWWRFHVIHHAVERLDWLSAVRVHPVNDILATLLEGIPLFCLGFRLELVAALGPALLFYAVFLHANVRFDYGPLRYVIASPAFHRWHHASDAEGLDRNFAGLFPIWDLLFGTYHLPNRPPTGTGVPEPVPPGFWRQLAFPWRRPRGGKIAMREIRVAPKYAPRTKPTTPGPRRNSEENWEPRHASIGAHARIAVTA